MVKDSVTAVEVATAARAASSARIAVIHYNAPVHLHRGNLFLVGLPGAGKSTLGRQLARRLGKTFVDADAELERKLGVTIPTIFEIEGEASFRDREEAALAELAALTNIVLATGGGVVIRPANRERLKANGTVVYLHAPPATLYERTRRSRHRPLLNTPDRARGSPSSMRCAIRCIAKSPTASSNRAATRSRASRASSRPRSRTRSAHERARDVGDAQTLDVALGERSYPIHVGAGIARRSGSAARAAAAAHRASIDRHQSRRRRALARPAAPKPRRARASSEVLLIPDGEANKTLGDAATIC